MMENEFDYRSFFELDEGDALKKVVMTTYSFDITLLPLIWLYAGKEGHLIKYIDSFGNRRFYKNVFSDYIEVSGSPFVTVFYQEDLMTNSSLRDNELIRAILKYPGLCPQKHDGKICFHPKMICLEVWRSNGTKYYKMAVLSRNLTKSESAEAAVVLKRECKPQEKLLSEIMSDSNGEEELFSCFAECIQTEGWKKCEREGDIWKTSEEPVSAEVFVQKTGDPNSSIHKKMMQPDRGEITEAYIISPGFNDNAVLKTINGIDNKNKHFAKVMQVKQTITHEKIYVFQRAGNTGRCYEIWIGSSNCSARGLGNRDVFNTECMVCLSFCNDEMYQKYIEAIYGRYDFYDTWEVGTEADDLEIENDKEYFDVCGKIMKFIHGTEIQVSGSINDNGNYDLSLCIQKKSGSDLKPEEWKEYQGKIGLRFAVSSQTVKQESQAGDKWQFRYNNIPAKRISNEVVVIETDKVNNKMVTVSRITKAVFDSELQKVLSEKFEHELRGIKEKFEKERQYFPERNHSGTGTGGTHSNNGTGQIVFSVGDGDYEKLMKVYARGGSDELGTYISFWNDMYGSNPGPDVKNLIAAAKILKEGVYV